MFCFEFKEIYALLDTFKLHLESAERTPDAFKEEDEEEVANLIKSIQDIIPKLEKYCVTAKKRDEKERQARKSEFSSEKPELSEETTNLDSDDDDIIPELEKLRLTAKRDEENEQQAQQSELSSNKLQLSEKTSNLDSDDDDD